MSASLGIALQGFLLTPIAMAVQGLLAADAPPPVFPAAQDRLNTGTGGGPNTQISLREFRHRRRKRRLQALAQGRAVQAQAAAHARHLRHRHEDELITLGIL